MSIKSKLVRCYIKVKERQNNGISYVYQRKKTDTLVVVFSGFAGKNVPAKYNLVRTLFGRKEARLFLLDNFGYKKVGSYYLGNSMGLWNNSNIEKLIRSIIERDKYNNIIFCGSSKGGTAALLYGLKMNVTKIIIGSPQYKIGEYLLQNEYHKLLLKEIIGDSGVTVDFLNNILKMQITNCCGGDKGLITLFFKRVVL